MDFEKIIYTGELLGVLFLAIGIITALVYVCLGSDQPCWMAAIFYITSALGILFAVVFSLIEAYIYGRDKK